MIFAMDECENQKRNDQDFHMHENEESVYVKSVPELKVFSKQARDS